MPVIPGSESLPVRDYIFEGKSMREMTHEEFVQAVRVMRERRAQADPQPVGGKKTRAPKAPKPAKQEVNLDDIQDI